MHGCTETGKQTARAHRPKECGCYKTSIITNPSPQSPQCSTKYQLLLLRTAAAAVAAAVRMYETTGIIRAGRSLEFLSGTPGNSRRGGGGLPKRKPRNQQSRCTAVYAKAAGLKRKNPRQTATNPSNFSPISKMSLLGLRATCPLLALLLAAPEPRILYTPNSKRRTYFKETVFVLSSLPSGHNLACPSIAQQVSNSQNG